MIVEVCKPIKHIRAFLKLVEKRKVAEIVLPTARVLCRDENGVYSIKDSDTADSPALRGIWIHLRNYPGKNRDLECFLYFHFPHYVEVDPKLENLNDRLFLRGKYLHYNLTPEELKDPYCLNEHLKKFEKIILAGMYLYTKEKEEGNGNN